MEIFARVKKVAIYLTLVTKFTKLVIKMKQRKSLGSNCVWQRPLFWFVTVVNGPARSTNYTLFKREEAT